MKYGIMGASGHLGRKTLDAALKRVTAPSDIIALTRTPEKMAGYAALGVDVRWADYNDPASLMEAFVGVDVVLLIPSTAAPVDRVRQYENAIAAARKARIGHLLHFSLVCTALDSPFLVTPFLLYAESAIRTCGLKWTILRNSLYADTIANWVPEILKMGTIPYPTGEGRCSYISRNDIARAGAAVLTTIGHAGRIYHLTGPEALTTSDLCQAVAEVTGKPIVDSRATDDAYLKTCENNGTPGFHAHLLLSMYHAVRRGFMDVVTEDVRSLTGTPPERFRDYLKKAYTGR
ncbi:MAG: SDR family oxidoreductase [Pseudomonadota bacterium]